MNWFYKIENEVTGPIEIDALTHAYKDGVINAETWVRREEDKDWRALGECFDLEATFGHHDKKEGSAPPEAEADAINGRVIDQRICAQSGETWPEHMMIRINNEWVAKAHLEEYQTQFLTKQIKKRKIKSLVVGLLVLVTLVGGGGGGYLFWQQKKAAEAEAARLAALAAETPVDAAIRALTEGDANSAQGAVGGSPQQPGVVHGGSSGFSAADEALAEQQQMQNVTGALLDTFGVKPPETGGPALPGNPGSAQGSSPGTASPNQQQAAAWSKSATSKWPVIMLNNTVMIKNMGIYAGGRGFLLETPSGNILGVASVSFLSEEGDPRKLATMLHGLPQSLQSWEMYPVGDSKRKVSFKAVYDNPKSVLEQIKITHGNVILSSEGFLPNDLPGVPLVPQTTVPPLGEMVYVLIGKDKASGTSQAVQPGAVIEHDPDSEGFILGMRKGVSLGTLIGSPVISMRGLLAGIIGGQVKTEDAKLSNAGVIKVKVTPSARLVSLFDNNQRPEGQL